MVQRRRQWLRGEIHGYAAVRRWRTQRDCEHHEGRTGCGFHDLCILNADVNNSDLNAHSIGIVSGPPEPVLPRSLDVIVTRPRR